MNKIIGVLLLCVGSVELYANDLIDVYQQSLQYDPIFKAAYNTYLSQSEQVPQARASLLPHLTASSQVGTNQLKVSTSSANIKESYQQNTWSLTASQAIFDYKYWSQLQQAKASVKAAYATYNDAAQNLILRTASSYLAVLYAHDKLEYANAKKRANKRQLDQATQRYNVGLEPITSVYDAQAAFDQSTADVIAATNNETNQKENLRRLTNQTYKSFAPLSNKKLPLVLPAPNRKEDWTSTGLLQNYQLLAAQYTLEAARENVSVNKAGNWPVLSLEGTTTQTNNNKIHNAANVSNTNNSYYTPAGQQSSNVAIAVSFPVFQGGLVLSQTRQANFNFQVANDNLQRVKQDVIVNTTIAFNTIVDGISKIKADRQTLSSQENSVQSTEAQFLVGTRTMVDLVLAQQHLYEAQNQLAKDQYDYIRSILNLKYCAGTLNVADLQEINTWLQASNKA